MAPSEKRPEARLPFFIAARTVLNTGYRMVYPFLAVFARALGVDIKTMALALSLRAAAGALGPLLAPLSDRRGRRFGMTLGLGLFTAGALAPLLGARFTVFLAAIILMTVGKYVFDPAIFAHFGDTVPYERRGFVLAAAELAWALAFIAGIPAAGFLIARSGWRSPFLALACLGFLSLVMVRLLLRGGRPAQGAAEDNHPQPGHLANFRAVLASPVALLGLAIILAASTGNEIVNVVFGVWLEDSFGLKIAALGAASAAIGVAEFGGEGLVALTVDRIGKTRAIFIGLAANAAVAALLPLAGRSPASAVAGLTLFYLTFEYTVVSIIPVMSEILPQARATLLAFYAAAFSLGRAIGSWLSPRLYAAGFPAVASAAVLMNIVAFLALLRLRRRAAGTH